MKYWNGTCWKTELLRVDGHEHAETAAGPKALDAEPVLIERTVDGSAIAGLQTTDITAVIVETPVIVGTPHVTGPTATIIEPITIDALPADVSASDTPKF